MSKQEITHIFVTNITVLDTASSLRHDEEYAHLQHRLARSRGKWDSSHPRHRLLTALHGYTRYKERHLVETEGVASPQVPQKFGAFQERFQPVGGGDGPPDQVVMGVCVGVTVGKRVVGDAVRELELLFWRRRTASCSIN